MLSPFFLGYAEIHYNLKFLFPRYFKKQPEIIADVPIRNIRSISPRIPVLIIIKDSNLFPIKLDKINIEITAREKKISQDFYFKKYIKQNYYSFILYLDIDSISSEQILDIYVFFSYQQNNKSFKCINDNYYKLPLKPFKCYLSENPLPYPINWFAGEPHYHSIYTSDQVEFGADIQSTVQIAKSIGLKWLFITDHSYDLDDTLDDYTKKDPALPKWKAMKKDVSKIDKEDFRVIAGEEVSIGNYKGRNVHLLAVNHDKFIEGSGDSAEEWFKNKPQRFLKEVYKLHTDDNLFIAAHPNEKVPFLQKITLRRGNWSIKDYLESDVNFLQIINNSNFDSVEESIFYWKELLLKGYKFYLLAGNDAHGNFNVMRQIKVPFLKLFSSNDQVFGKFFTMFHFERNEPISGLKSGEIIVSNGPFLDFYLESGSKKYHIGSNTEITKGALHYQAKTTQEFGEINRISLFIGDYSSRKEKRIKNVKNNIEVTLPEKGYIRMELRTRKMGRVITNPIWIDSSSL